jgi:probable rRNA maturation factor
MSVTVEIFGESRYKFDRKKIRETVEKTLTSHGVSGEAEVCVMIVGERKMTTLHKKYMKEDGPTDVLSFPLEGVNYPDDVLRLGDVVVCYPVAVKQAGEENMMVDDKISFLVEHGCLHLLGIHHE